MKTSQQADFKIDLTFLISSNRTCVNDQKEAFYNFNVLVYFYKFLIKRKPPGFYKVLTEQKNITYLLPLTDRQETKTKC